MNLRNIIIGIIVLGLVGVGGYFGYLYYIGGDVETTDLSEVSSTVEVEDTEGGTVFSIVPEESEVSFTLEEDLAGVRTTVIGTTNQVAGDIFVNFDSPQNSEIGAIVINSRSLSTDNGFRNGALRSNILRSSNDAYEFITFTPTAINGLPETVTVGESYEVQIVGDLRIIETTNEVTFDATITIDSESRISGTANTVITYGDWGIPIPSAPRVANVTSETTLAINFVASSAE